MNDLRARPISTRYAAAEPTVIVVPTFNEKGAIRELVKQFFTFVSDVQLLVVDDDSPDGTADLVERLQSEYSQLRLLRRKSDRGLGRAYVAGITYGLEHNFQIIGTMDADLSHDPAYLPRQLMLAESHEVVIGSRYIRDGGTVNWQIRRILLSWLANKYAAKLLGLPLHDLTSGFRLYRREVLERLDLSQIKSSGYSFLAELLYRCHQAGADIVESPIIFYDRTQGASKLRPREIYIGAFNLVRLRLSTLRNHSDR